MIPQNRTTLYPGSQVCRLLCRTANANHCESLCVRAVWCQSGDKLHACHMVYELSRCQLITRCLQLYTRTKLSFLAKNAISSSRMIAMRAISTCSFKLVTRSPFLRKPQNLFTFLIVTHDRQNTPLLSPRCLLLLSRKLVNRRSVRSRGRTKKTHIDVT